MKELPINNLTCPACHKELIKEDLKGLKCVSCGCDFRKEAEKIRNKNEKK